MELGKGKTGEAHIEHLPRRELDAVFESSGLRGPGRGVAVDVGDVLELEGFNGRVDVGDGDVGAGGCEGLAGGEAEAGGAAGDEDGFAGEEGEVEGGDWGGGRGGGHGGCRGGRREGGSGGWLGRFEGGFMMRDAAGRMGMRDERGLMV